MSAADAFRDAGSQLRANPRLRWGVWAILGILWFYGVLVLRDEVPKRAEAYNAVARKIARTQAVATQTTWGARREAAVAAQAQLENRLWQAPTLGLAQATFNDWLRDASNQTKLSRPNLTIAAQEDDTKGAEGMPKLWKVTARMGFDFTPQSLYALLARIGGYDKAIQVESLTVRGSPTPRAELQLVAYFRTPAAAGPGAKVAAGS